uniref:Internexin neuronal intermediate filament protein alpha n=1 Tax=Sphenodon punctatus TaxID=8508 RepID=A0A8D0H0H0_SPHPU
MSFTSDAQYLSSSYRKIFGDPPRYLSPSSRLGGCSVSTSSSYRSLSLAGGSRSHVRGPRSQLGEGLDLRQSSARSSEYRLSRASEKEQLQGLNDRFAGYIERVRQLEQQNRGLEAELGALRQRQAEPSRLRQLFQGELRELRAQLEEANAARAQAGLEREQLAEEVERMRGRWQEEARGRAEAEQARRAQQQEADRAALARLELEQKVEALREELAFVRRVHQEELAELQPAEPPEPAGPEPPTAGAELTAALQEIRTQYESLAAKNLQAAEEWYRAKFAGLHEQAARSSQAIRASREEIHEYRRQLQARTLELEGLRAANEALERQIQELEERHGAETAALQDTIGELENDLRNTKSEMARHLREYQDLLNVKMALDIEIAAYRKLLEGEETRFSTSSIGMTGLNPHPNPSYSFQPRAFISSVVSSSKLKKEEKEEAAKETIMSTKKTERTNLDEGNLTSQKM